MNRNERNPAPISENRASVEHENHIRNHENSPSVHGSVSDPIIKFSLMANISSPHQASERECKLSELVKVLTTHDVRESRDGMVIGHLYGEKAHRCDENFSGTQLLFFDIDNKSGSPSLPEDYFDNLDGLTYIWHSTWRNSPSSPRWRLIVVLDSVISRDEFPAYMAHVRQLLNDDLNIDIHSYKMSQCFYLPSCPQHMQEFTFRGVNYG